MQNYPYASLVGSLMYAQVCTRPDISHAVGMLGRFQSNPGLAHWKAAKKVLRYLKGTRNNMLTYRKSTHPQMVGFSDSDFGGCHDSRHCTLGYVYLLCGGILVAEFVSEFKALSFVDKPLTLYCDNQAAIFFSKHDRISKGAKHMDLKYLSLKQDVKREKFVIEHIGTELMVADIFTKALPPKTFKKHAEKNFQGNLEEEILCRVPAKSLKRLRYSCKEWDRLLDDVAFRRKHVDKSAKQFTCFKLMKKLRISEMSLNLDVHPPSVEVKAELSLLDPRSSKSCLQFDVAEVFHCDGLLLCVSEEPEPRIVVWNPFTGQTRWIESGGEVAS
ncbi:unnamed protein product [Microthlaspi erraticum]|uniref:F-box associated beta-propeller type 1 domain-containing protein n=1 Tax=Microthlaspi erraticum TaxID=1685480 RepID=A0A6D2KQS2_9BRAS|nr:unnamed protein product [Microthlaspi erraticum]